MLILIDGTPLPNVWFLDPKRIDRFLVSLPSDWGAGYDNVNIGCTVENQALADYRLPRFLSYPIKQRFIACAPLLEAIGLAPYLHGVDHVTVGGETGRETRVCDYDWVLKIREQCVKADVTFWFKNTGSLFKRDGIGLIIVGIYESELRKKPAADRLMKAHFSYE